MDRVGEVRISHHPTRDGTTIVRRSTCPRMCTATIITTDRPCIAPIVPTPSGDPEGASACSVAASDSTCDSDPDFHPRLNTNPITLGRPPLPEPHFAFCILHFAFLILHSAICISRPPAASWRAASVQFRRFFPVFQQLLQHLLLFVQSCRGLFDESAVAEDFRGRERLMNGLDPCLAGLDIRFQIFHFAVRELSFAPIWPGPCYAISGWVLSSLAEDSRVATGASPWLTRCR
jgi:hypothetical protein